MEPEAVEFLRKVGKSIMVGFLWLAINAIAAIKGDNAFIGDTVKLSNIIFYIWFIISVVLLVYIFKKMWQKEIASQES